MNKAQTNVYLLAGPAGALLIDAAADAPTILRFLGRYPLQTIVTTHSHTDQFQALARWPRPRGHGWSAADPTAL